MHLVAQGIFKLFDIDGDGTIDFGEFVKSTAHFCLFDKIDLLKYFRGLLRALRPLPLPLPLLTLARSAPPHVCAAGCAFSRWTPARTAGSPAPRSRT